MPKHISRKLAVLSLFLIGTSPFPASAENSSPTSLPSPLTQQGWKELQIPGENPAQFTLTKDDSISVKSDAGVSFLYRELTPKEKTAQTLSWTWRVDQQVPATDPGASGQDDRSLAVHLWFPDNRELSLWESLESELMSLFGVPRIGKVLTYAYGGSGKRRQLIANPHLKEKGRIYLLRPSGSPIQSWFTESVNLTADYQEAFQQPYQAPRFLALSSDSDNSKTQSAGLIAHISFGN